MAPGRSEDAYACTESNAKYRKYVAAVEAALKNFEYTTEWADLISALGKLTKVFQQHAKFADIPRPLVVAKRLSQCLHPALPSGVHLKALENYSQIFDIIGADALPKSVHLYSIGLFPVMSYAGIRVKSALLDLLEKYYVPLGVSLKPTMVGFLTGALHGLEEGTEFFDRVNSLLTSVQHCVGDDYMMSCLWHCVAASPPIRLPALIYINSKYDRRKPVDDQLYIVGTSNDRMVSALCAAATDTSQLVQRHLLDFLVAAFPLDGGHLVRDDLVRLVRAALFVVLRREMSLNRRLFTWLTGQQNAHSLGSSLDSSGGSSVDMRYFTGHALTVCRDALLSHLKQSAKHTDPMQNAIRVLRLYAYLLDRPEIAMLLLDKCLFDTIVFVATNDQLHDSIKPQERDASVSPVCGEWLRRRRPLSVAVGALRPSHGHDASAAANSSEEASRAINALLGLCDTDFVWKQLAAQSDRLALTDARVDRRGGRAAHDCDQLVDPYNFALVVRYALSFVHLSAHSDIRLVHLPRLCRTLVGQLHKVANGDMAAVRMDKAAIVLDLLGDLLMEMLQAVVPIKRGNDASESAVVGTSPVTSLTLNASLSETRLDQVGKDAEQGSASALSPDDDKLLTGDGQGQRIVESCKRRFCAVFECVAQWLLRKATWAPDECRLLAALCTLAKGFVDFPLYCWPETNTLARQPSEAADSASGWLCELRRLSLADENRAPFAVRAQALDTMLYVVVMSQQIIEQHDALALRNGKQPFEPADADAPPASQCGQSSVLLLRPFAAPHDLRTLEADRFYEHAAEAMWRALGAAGAGAACDNLGHAVHAPAARLLYLLHSCDGSSPSSVAESVLLGHMTSGDGDERARAALLFVRLWTLARDYDADNCLPAGVDLKPFNRLILALLSYACHPNDSHAADTTSGMNSRCKSWILDDCLRHNDMPKLLQAIAACVLHRGSARVSIQYMDLMGTVQLADSEAGRAKLAALETRAGLPLYHITRPTAASGAHWQHSGWHCGAPPSCSVAPAGLRTCVSLSTKELAWQRQLRNRLLSGQPLVEAASTPFATPPKRVELQPPPVVVDTPKKVGRAPSVVTGDNKQIVHRHARNRSIAGMTRGHRVKPSFDEDTLRQFMAAAGGPQAEPPIEVVVKQVLADLVSAVCDMHEQADRGLSVTDVLRTERLQSVAEGKSHARHPSMKEADDTDAHKVAFAAASQWCRRAVCCERRHSFHATAAFSVTISTVGTT